MWTDAHRNKGPGAKRPPGYQSREAVAIQRTLPGAEVGRRMSYEQLQEVSNLIIGSRRPSPKAEAILSA